MPYSSTGTLYAIGVGSGAPDLITLRAVNILSSVDVVLAAASPKNDASISLSIAQKYLPESTQILRLDFPMTQDQELLNSMWKKNTKITADILLSGKSAAFLTLGDPLIYSTFGYIMRNLQEEYPELPIEIVPGITSFQTAAAKTQTILCEGKESLTIVPGINSKQELKATLAKADSAVILKVYKNANIICESLASDSRAHSSIFASQLGMENEVITHGIQSIPQNPPYLSLLLVPPKRS